MKKRLLCIFLALAMVLVLPACDSDEAVETAAATAEPDVFRTLPVIQNGECAFSIVHDNTAEALDLASNLRMVIARNFNVDVPISEPTADPAEFEIVVGDAREIAQKTAAKLREEKDFGIKVEENALVLYAVDTQSYTYLNAYLEQVLFAKTESGDLTVDSDDNLIYTKSSLMSQNYIQYLQGAEADIQLAELFDFKIFQNSDTTLPYRIYVPFNYSPKESYPLLVNLHGAGLRGQDNVQHLKFLDKLMLQTELPLDDAIIIVPQCPEGEKWVDTSWAKGSYSISNVPESNELAAVVELVQELIDTYPVDQKRIYACGFSMGGYGTWDLLMRHPDLFCAGIPMCGAGDPTQASKLKNIGIWAIHGAKDPTVPVAGSRDMAQALEDVGATKFTYTEHPNAEHDVWNSTYSDGMIFNWLFEQKKA